MSFSFGYTYLFFAFYRRRANQFAVASDKLIIYGCCLATEIFPKQIVTLTKKKKKKKGKL